MRCASDRPRLYRMTSCCGLTPTATINSLPDIFVYICETIKYTEHNWQAGRNPSENKRGRHTRKIYKIDWTTGRMRNEGCRPLKFRLFSCWKYFRFVFTIRSTKPNVTSLVAATAH